MAPLGKPAEPIRSRFDVEYADVDLLALTNLLETEGLRIAGRATGRNLVDWPNGKWAQRVGDGEVSITPPVGVNVLGPRLPAGAADEAEGRALEQGPFSNHRPLEPVGIGGRMTYRFDPAALWLEPSEMATSDTYVAFEGATAWGDRSKIPFRVTSTNWQESDRLLAGIITAFGASTMAIPIDGVGRFDGVMLGAFSRPRIEGRFVGSALHAWDVTWGDVDADFVVENSYANVSRAVLRDGFSQIDVTGQFALGYPRRDGGEEIDARVRVSNRTVADFLAAFDLEDYDVQGLVSGDFHLYGQYTRPFGFGRLTIDRGIAYDEPFAEGEAASASRAPACASTGCTCSEGGTAITGAALRRLERRLFVQRRRPRHGRGNAGGWPRCRAVPGFTGLLDFSATGSGTFDEPRYDVKFERSRSVLSATKASARVSGRMSVRGTVLVYELEVASTRLAASGTGRIALTDEMDAELSFRITDTSLDPYVRAFRPQLSPFTSAVASGSHPRRRRALQSRRPARRRRRRGCGAAVLRLRAAERRRTSAWASTARSCASTRCGWSARAPSSIWRARSTSRTRRGLALRPTAPPTWRCCRASLPDVREFGPRRGGGPVCRDHGGAGRVGQRAAARTAASGSSRFPHALEA